MNAFKTLAASAVIGLATTSSLAAEETRPLITVVASENAQTQLMAMVLSTQAVQQGHSLHMLLCGAAGDIALRDAPEAATAPQPPRGASPQAMLSGLIDAGATVEVCAIYLPGQGIEADALVDGVGVAQPPAMAQAMLADNVMVWSF